MKNALFLFLISFSLDTAADEPELRAPPAGFAWQWCEEIRAAFLRPQNWNFKHIKNKDTYSCFITNKKIEKGDDEFQTGLTVRVTSGIGKKSGGKASDYADAHFRKATEEKKNVISMSPPAVRGAIRTYNYRIKQDGKIVQTVVVVDDKADRFYLIFFASPKDEWEEAWKTGEKIMKNIFIEFPE